MKQEVETWLGRGRSGWKQSATRAVRTCAYRLNIAGWTSSWNVEWKGRKGGEIKERRGRRALPSSKAAWREEEEEEGEVKKHVGSAKLTKRKHTTQSKDAHQRNREQQKEEDVNRALSVRSSNGWQTCSSTWQHRSDGWARVWVDYKDPEWRLKQTLERNSHLLYKPLSWCSRSFCFCYLSRNMNLNEEVDGAFGGLEPL